MQGWSNFFYHYRNIYVLEKKIVLAVIMVSSSFKISFCLKVIIVGSFDKISAKSKYHILVIQTSSPYANKLSDEYFILFV